MSNWDFGRQPADHHDAGSFRDNDLTYPMGGVQWTGNRDWTDPGFDGFGGSDGFTGSGSSGGAEDLDDLDSAPYPITYERDLDDLDELRPPATQYEPYAPWPPAKDPDDRFAPDVKPAPAPATFAADDEFATARFAAVPPAARPFAADPYATGPRAVGDQLSGESWLRAPAPGARPSGEPPRAWADDQWQGGPQWPAQPGDGTGPSRSWLTYAGVVVAAAAIGGAAVFLTGGHSHGQAAGTTTRTVTPPAPGRAASQSAAPIASATPKASATAKASTAPSTSAVAALSMAQAQGVLAGYTTANNAANHARDDAQLAAIETGSSDAIDAGLYLMQGAAGAAPYPAFAPASSTYYIPAGEPATGPRWFVVRVSNAFLSSPKKVSSAEYLLFTQATPGGPWKNAIEPYLFSGASVPQPAIGANGLATPVTATTTALATSPGQLPALTAASLNGTGTITNPGNLEESADQRFWQGKLPSATVTDTHALVTGNEGETFALRTTSGGALVFYTDAATLTITPPTGSVLHLTIPGLYSSAQSLPTAALSYLDQFAAYDPPAGSGTPSIVADYSGITGKA
jgi:hypothetical protein